MNGRTSKLIQRLAVARTGYGEEGAVFRLREARRRAIKRQWLRTPRPQRHALRVAWLAEIRSARP